MGEDRKPPAKPEAPTRKARKFELEAALAEQERKAGPALYVDDEDDRTEVRTGGLRALGLAEAEEEEERTQVRNPRPAAGYVPSLDDDEAPSEETGRAFYNPPEDVPVRDDDAPRHDTEPVPPPVAPPAAPITAPLAPPIGRPLAHFVPSVPPAVRAIPPGPHGAGSAIHVPPPPAVPLDGDELAAITRDFQRRRRRVLAAVSIILAIAVIALLVHEPLLEAIRGP